MSSIKDNLPHPKGNLTLKIQADNQSLNTMGGVCAGWIAMNLDQAGEIRARQEVENHRIVTASIGTMSFLKSVKPGDLISFYTQITEIGRSSIKIAITVWIENFASREKLTETTITYVAVNDEGGTTQIIRQNDEGYRSMFQY